MKRLLVLIAWSVGLLVVGFAAGIYALPILTASKARPAAEIESLAQTAMYRGQFRRDLKGSDALHWGEGTVSINPRTISLAGKIAPGPDYKLYLSPEFVETEEAFLQLKPQAVRVGDVRSFENFVVPVPPTVDVAQFTTVVVWCEAFSQFITAATYRSPAVESIAASTPGPKKTFLVVYSPGPAWRIGKPIKEQPLKEHGPYILNLYAQGQLLSAGPFLDDTGGAVLLSAPDLASARTLVENDPAVRTGVFIYQLHPWYLVDWQQRLEKGMSDARSRP